MAELIPERALRALGDLLGYEDERVEIVVIGGSALILMGFVDRATADVDVLAVGRQQGSGSRIRPPDPLPDPLRRAIERVAEDLGLPPHWMNTVAGLQWQTGLPPGLEQRLEWREYGGLGVGLVSRYDLIFFKLYAAADDIGAESVHYQDLLALRPTLRELKEAVAWITSQDVSEGFRTVLEEVVERVKQDVETGA